jgi:hypothetical protein
MFLAVASDPRIARSRIIAPIRLPAIEAFVSTSPGLEITRADSGRATGAMRISAPLPR